jgi:hypothetical protein
MKRIRLEIIFGFLILFSILVACNFSGKPKLGKHKVVLDKICISDNDFRKNTFGNPLDIEVSLLKDGIIVGSILLSGKRGERYIEKNNTWTIEYSTRSNYQIVMEERSIIAISTKYSIPGTPKLGDWLFSRKINIGTSSYIEFKDTALE